MGKILLIEDDEALRKLILAELEMLQFAVKETGNGKCGLDMALAERFDLIILDLNLPELDGLDICKSLRTKEDETPILMLTARKDNLDRVLGLELGADDYLVKPFVMRELLARIKAILKRTSSRNQAPSAAQSSVLRFGSLEVNFDLRRVSVSGKMIKLSAMEFDLLAFLAKNNGKAYTREELMANVWGYSAVGYEQNVTTHIARIRAKLEQNTDEPMYLKTIKGFGYAFASPDDFAE